MLVAIIGPTQPYLARVIGEDISTINWMWTGRAIGVCITSIVCGFIFKQYLTKKWMKLGFLGLIQILSGLFIFMIPWMPSLPVLILVAGVYGMGLGFYDTGKYWGRPNSIYQGFFAY